MKLSVIIVNYNVKYFLEQCLYSVQRALKNIEGEVFVVDNNSVDGSCEMLRHKFTDIHLIENKKNYGFSYANNQAIKISTGEYVLLLNPDTLVEEDTFTKICDFMDMHPDAGGLGVKMIDGNGNFLPESKRGLPTPWVAFYKIFGLSRLFPKSAKFNRYHLGFLDKDDINEVEILSGAFMLIRKATLDKTGLLDETFFMYGEDIDLSYRILKAGYKNYYFPKTTIIHYKGESTKKGSINYVLVFYNAMIIFARKHFTQKRAHLFNLLINFAIYFRAGLSILKRFLLNIFIPVIDFLVIYLGYWFFLPFWEHYKFPVGGSYKPFYLHFMVPLYIFIWIISILFSGGYDKPIKIPKTIKGLGVGTILILVMYSLMREDFRFSRALILLGSFWALISTFAVRLILHFSKFPNAQLHIKYLKKIIIVGRNVECARVSEMLQQTGLHYNLLGFVSPSSKTQMSGFIGHLNQIQDMTRINKIDEIIFCSKDISSQKIIKTMLKLSNADVSYKIASPDSVSIIGSNSIDTAGELYTIDINSIAKSENVRNKRMFDLLIALLMLVILPVMIIVVNRRLGFIKNIFNVIIGSLSWVGYSTKQNVNIYSLPKIKTGVLSPDDIVVAKKHSKESIEKLNMFYAKNYRIWTDLMIILKRIKELGR